MTKRMFKSFYARLSAIFLVLILVLGAGIFALYMNTLVHFVDETEQSLQKNLADILSVQFEPYLVDHIDSYSIERKIREFTGINPRIEIYLLNNEGQIKAFFGCEEEDLETFQVDVEPIRRFLTTQDLPILGDDPQNLSRRKPFSAAPITIMGEDDCYIYVILGSDRYDTAAAMIRNSYIIRDAFIALLVALVLTAIAGLVLFRIFTKRLRRVTEVVNSVKDGEMNRRISMNSDDEIGELADAFDNMAHRIEQTLKDLQCMDRQRREMIVNISHDLRSPLASIQGYLETVMLMGDNLTTKERQRYMEVVSSNTQKLNKLVSELFELSKLDAKHTVPQKEHFSIAELINDLVIQYQPIAEQKQVTLIAEIPNNLAMVFADIGLVERAISNLMDNAIKYTSEGGSVSVKPSNDKDFVTIDITDTGSGIPAEDLPFIFDRFYRVDKSRTSETGGSGLGLAIAKRILELHDSTLKVESELAKGTAFQFSLPILSK